MTSTLEELRRFADDPLSNPNPYAVEAERAEWLALCERITAQTQGKARLASEQRQFDNATLAIAHIDAGLRVFDRVNRAPSEKRAAEADRLRRGLAPFLPGSRTGSADRFGDEIRGAIDDVMNGRSEAFVDFPEHRALTEAGAAGDGVPLQILSPVQSLRAKSVVMSLPGIRLENMTSDRARWPRIGAATVGTAAEVATLTSADTNTDTVDVVAAKYGAVDYISSELVEDYSASALATFGNNLLSWLALKVDAGLLEGDGSGPGIVGLRQTAGINTTSVAATLTLAKFRAAEYELRLDNAEPVCWVLHPRTWKTAQDIVTGIASDTTTVLSPNQQEAARTLLGYPVHFSTQLTLTEGAGAGSWVGLLDTSQIVVCERRPARLEVSKEFKFDSDQLAIRATWRGGLAVLNPEAVSVLTDVRT